MANVSWEHASIVALLELSAHDHRQASRIVRSVQQLAASGVGDIVKLHGFESRWRLRVGDWRIVFVREGRDYHVLEVVNRRDAYR